MHIEDVENLFLFCGGLGMFLYGMKIMSDGIQRSAGEKMRQLLGILTNNRFLAVLVGALITAIIQSSGATTVMVVGFVNAGIMTLTQAVGVIMGANIGTCMTSWIVSMGQLGDSFKAISPELYAPLLVGIGAFLVMFAKKQGKQLVGQILVGLGFLFLGLDFMKDSAGCYTDLPIFTQAFRLFGSNPLLGILMGAIVTAIMQSSSASVGILQMLASSGNAVTTAAAIYISLGSNIGSCVTALLSSIGAPKNARRAAVIHLSFNVIGACIFGVGMYILFLFHRELQLSSIDSVGISIFHTVFNITCTVLLFPFANALVKLSGLVVRDDEKKITSRADDSASDTINRHLDERFLRSPAVAVETARKEVVRMGCVTLNNARMAVELIKTRDTEQMDKIYQNEKIINELEEILTEYLAKVNNLSLSESQHQLVSHLFYTIRDIERVGDHTENIAEQVQYMIERKLKISDVSLEEIMNVGNIAIDAFENAIECRSSGSLDAMRKVVSLEDEVDTLQEEIHDSHIERLSRGACNPAAGLPFMDILSNLERISDHAVNIAGYVKDEM